MRGLPKAMRLYCSEEAHYSNNKAAWLLGIGEQNVRTIKVDEQFRMDTADLVRQIEADFDEGHLPFCVVANAGSVNTGAVDPMDAMADICRRFDLWLHVDGAYGGFAALSETGRRLFAGISRADSVTLDPHKWLYLPMGSGCVIYRDPAGARRAFGHDAEYMRVFQREPDEAYSFWNYGPELSRRFRALSVWMLLKCVGASAIGDAIERNIDCARYVEHLICVSPDFEMLAPVELSIFCFRYCPPEWKQGLHAAGVQNGAELDEALDRLNERLLLELQRGGDSYLSNARVRGRFALRGCVLNHRTTRQDMEILLDDLRRIGKRLS
jgi:glutamate/tyrosine decarboxylase-like PLP-dependent enzyme